MSRSGNRKIIQDAIRELGKAEKYEVYSGEVDSIKESDATIDVKINEDITIYDVRLRCVVDSEGGMYVIPAQGSFVTIAQIDGGQDFQLIHASKVDKVIIKIENSTLEITNNGFVFNGGNLDGMIKINSLTSEINDRLNLIKTAALAGFTAVDGSITALGGAAAGASAWNGAIASYTPLNKSQYENTKIKH